jgi:plastocyanin
MPTSRARRGRVPSVVAIALLSTALLPGVARASGGGGCGAPVTDGTGAKVQIDQSCFTPTILRVEPGSTVVFRNVDPMPHTVLGANAAWGSYDALKRRDVSGYRFEDAGVYPYVCTWHVGMIGVVVVGDGIGGAMTTNTKDGPVVKVADADLGSGGALAAAVTPRTPEEASGSAVLLWAALALALVLVIVLLRRRGRSLA